MSMEPALINFLKQPDSYPHDLTGEISHIQTHISHVFIVPPYVYKLKKPVNLDFLDFSTLDKRKKDCEREIQLNRRLCQNIYLEVLPIYSHQGSFSFEASGNEAAVTEYAVKMKQLPNQFFLDQLAEKKQLKQSHFDRIAEKLTTFYENQNPGKEVTNNGRIDQIKVNTDENFSQAADFIGQTIDEITYNTIKKYTDEYFSIHQELFEQRMQEQRIIDGHGDLHMEHIHISPDSICIYDCIEFNNRFRYQDVAADLAFLAMDLDFNGLQRWSAYFIHRMKRHLRDSNLLRIIDFYKCYRAYVRGKVESITSDEQDIPGEDRQKAAGRATRYFKLALQYALFGSKPTVIIVMGPIAGGKTTLANQISQRLPLDQYSSDEIRKKIAGLPLKERTPATKRDALYSPGMSQKTYDQLLENARHHISHHQSVILDATFSERERRTRFMEELQSRNINHFIIEANAPADVLKQRLKKRGTQEDIVSDARLEDFDKLRERYDSPNEISDDRLIRINTNSEINETVQALCNALVERNLQHV